MKVIVDPVVKQLFFDRIIELHNGSEYDAIKFIERIAYGEEVILAESLSGILKSLDREKELAHYYKKRYYDVKNKREKTKKEYGKLLRQVDEMDDEISQYCDEIKYYREILTAHGISEELIDYDDEGW